MTNGTFSGPAYSPHLDRERLTSQIERIRSYMLDAGWKTLEEIGSALESRYRPTHFPLTSISAQLRNLRKSPLLYEVQRRRRLGGLWEYRLLPPASAESEPRPTAAEVAGQLPAAGPTA